MYRLEETTLFLTIINCNFVFKERFLPVGRGIQFFVWNIRVFDKNIIFLNVMI